MKLLQEDTTKRHQNEVVMPRDPEYRVTKVAGTRIRTRARVVLEGRVLENRFKSHLCKTENYVHETALEEYYRFSKKNYETVLP